MAKNASREFATMDDDKRRRFSLEHPAADSDPDEEVLPVEFAADDPRRHPSSDARVNEKRIP